MTGRNTPANHAQIDLNIIQQYNLLQHKTIENTMTIYKHALTQILRDTLNGETN